MTAGSSRQTTASRTVIRTATKVAVLALLISGAAFDLGAALASAAGTATHPNVEIPTPACGAVEFPSSATGSWAFSGGVDVFSNGTSDEGTGDDCSSATSKVGGVTAGEEWQCVEFINRLFLTKGWITGTPGSSSPPWPGDAGPTFYNDAPGNLQKQPNGSVSYLGPGDVVIINVYYDGSLDGGHALVVNDSSDATSGSVNLVSQNSGYQGNSEPVVSGTLSGGSVTVGGGGDGWSYSTIGVVHAPPAQVAPIPPLIGELNTSGAFYVKEGGLSAQWVEESSSGIKAIALASDGTNGPLIGDLNTSGAFYVKEGGLSAQWVEETASAASIRLAPN